MSTSHQFLLNVKHFPFALLYRDTDRFDVSVYIVCLIRGLTVKHSVVSCHINEQHLSFIHRSYSLIIHLLYYYAILGVVESFSAAPLNLFMLSPPIAKVGKTSLIMSLVGEEFPEEVSVITVIHRCCVSS